MAASAGDPTCGRQHPVRHHPLLAMRRSFPVLATGALGIAIVVLVILGIIALFMFIMGRR
jgi:hypothetical protein